MGGMELVSMREIAQRLNVKYETVRQWRYRGLLPAPDFHLASGPAWRWNTIKKWAEETGRLA